MTRQLPALSEKVPLQTRLQICYQHDGAPRHFSQVISQYLNQQFPNRWIGRSGEQNWPSRSPDLNPLDYHVWGCTKAMVCARSFSTRQELLQLILSAGRSVSNAAVPSRVTSSLDTRVNECIHTDVSHFEQTCMNGELRNSNCIINNKCQKTGSEILLFLIHLTHCKCS